MMSEHPDLMPCQLCSGRAHMLDNVDDETDIIREYDQVGCSLCLVKGPVSHWASSRQKTGLDFLDFSLKQKAINRPKAAALWNEMQAFVARGRLLDAAPARKGGRL